MILTLFWKGGGGIALPLYTPLNGNIFVLTNTLKFKFWIDTKKMETHFSGALKQIKQFYVNIFEKNQLSRFLPNRNLSLWKLPTTKHYIVQTWFWKFFFSFLIFLLLLLEAYSRGLLWLSPPGPVKSFDFGGF